MKKDIKPNKTDETTLDLLNCPNCGEKMKKVSWSITAGAFDAGKEVEQTVYQCTADKNFASIEVSTGNKSEFAFDEEDKNSDEPESYLNSE